MLAQMLIAHPAGTSDSVLAVCACLALLINKQIAVCLIETSSKFGVCREMSLGIALTASPNHSPGPGYGEINTSLSMLLDSLLSVYSSFFHFFYSSSSQAAQTHDSSQQQRSEGGCSQLVTRSRMVLGRHIKVSYPWPFQQSLSFSRQVHAGFWV